MVAKLLNKSVHSLPEFCFLGERPLEGFEYGVSPPGILQGLLHSRCTLVGGSFASTYTRVDTVEHRVDTDLVAGIDQNLQDRLYAAGIWSISGKPVVHQLVEAVEWNPLKLLQKLPREKTPSCTLPASCKGRTRSQLGRYR